MRDYIFYPLSLSKSFAAFSRVTRKWFGPFVGKRMPSFLSMFVVYLLVGVWHGADWKYIAYGIWNGVFIMAGILLVDVYNKMKGRFGIKEDMFTWRLFQIGRTFVLVTIGRYFSRAGSFSAAIDMFRLTLLHKKDFSFVLDGTLISLGLDNANWILLIIAMIILFFVDYLHERGISIREKIAEQALIFRWAIYIGAVLSLLIFGISSYDSIIKSTNNFKYFSRVLNSSSSSNFSSKCLIKYFIFN